MLPRLVSKPFDYVLNIILQRIQTRAIRWPELPGQKQVMISEARFGLNGSCESVRHRAGRYMAPWGNSHHPWWHYSLRNSQINLFGDSLSFLKQKKKMRRREIIHNGRSTPKPRMSFSRWIWFAFLGLLRSIIPDHNIVNIVSGRCRVPEDSNCFSWGTPSANTFDNCGSLVVLRTRLQHWDHYEVMTVY